MPNGPQFKRAGEKLMAKSIKRGVQQDKLNADEMDDNNGRCANDEGVDPSMDGGNLSRKQVRVSALPGVTPKYRFV